MTKLDDIYSDYVDERFEGISLDRVVSAVREIDRLLMWKHPLGFFHAELSEFLPVAIGERFRLHVWIDNEGSRDGLGDLHEHTWHLTSLVLAGEVRDVTMMPVSSIDGAYAGSRINYGRINTSELVGSFNLELLLNREVGVGEHYEIPSRVVHLNAPSKVPTVTLVRSIEDERGDGPLVLTPRNVEVGTVTGVRQRVDGSEVLGELARLMRSSGS